MSNSKPKLGVDLDGVICRPPLGLNILIGKGPYEGHLNPHGTYMDSAKRGKLGSSPIISFLQKVKYIRRSPLPDAPEGLRAIKEHRDMILITSRNSLVQKRVEHWLERHGIRELFDAVHTNHLGIPSPEFKWHMVSQQGIDEFIDDDGRVADFLARRGLRRVYLRDWPRNRGYKYPESVIRVENLIQVAERLANNS